MENSKQRPRPSIKPPALEGDKKFLLNLLGVENKRLIVATRIEEERNIVFPETTVIIRDILRLKTAIDKLDKEEKENKGGYDKGFIDGKIKGYDRGYNDAIEGLEFDN